MKKERKMCAMGVCKKIKKKNNYERNIWELFKMYRIEKTTLGLSESSLRNYEESLKRFMRFMDCDDMLIKEIEHDKILEYIQSMQEEELSVASINHYLRDIRTFFNWCWKAGYSDKIDVQLVKGQLAVTEVYRMDELNVLLEKPRGDSYCEWRNWAIINWILATGNREKTVCNIKIGDINLQDGEILLQQTKNKKPQILPMSTELSFVLKQFIHDFRSDAEDQDYLFCNVAGEKLTENALKLAIRDYNLSRGVKRTSVHALRHTFAKLWINNNGDVFRLQKMLGHSTLDMTRNYVNLFSSDLKENFDEYSPLDKISRKKGMKHVIKRNRTM